MPRLTSGWKRVHTVSQGSISSSLVRSRKLRRSVKLRKDIIASSAVKKERILMKRKCLKCKSGKVISMVYGMPGLDLVEKEKGGEVKLRWC